MSNRLDQDREAKIQPERIQVAITALIGSGITDMRHDDTMIQFEYAGCTVTFWPYSGWHSGREIKDGRGLQNLLKQIKS